MGGDVLSEGAAVMRESLLKSQSITDSVVSVLGSFDHRLSALETAMRPTQIRTHAIRRAHENIDKTLKSAEVILAQFDLFCQAEAKILKGPHDDLDSYLEAIQQLRSNILFFNNNKSFKSSDGVVNHSNNLLAKAISKLEEEFKQLLSSYSKPVEPERLFECLPNSLRPSSESSGNQGDSTGRNPSSNSHSEHHHNNNLENADFTPPTLIPLRILPLLHNLAQQMVQAGHQQQLLKIYRDTRSSVLEESLRKLGVVETLFKGKACNEIRESAFGLTKWLAKTAQETFGDFEEAVEKDATKTAVLDGTVHPLTSYVINYVKFLFDYQSTLKQLFQEFENGEETNSQLASVTMRIMQALQTNLDGKSKQHKDIALTHLFLMNNIHYMVRSVRRSEAKDLLGDDWVQRHRRIVQQHANQYKRIAWAKILQCLSVQGLTSSGGGSAVGVDGGNSSGVSRAVVKDKLKTFNMQFEELHQRQSQWTVPDSELRESLRLAVAEVLLPAYRSFIKRFGPLVESGKNPMKYIRYSAEDLDRMLGEFFEGKTLNEPKRW
ncbi:Exocyst complex component EXO70A1 like [Actinidia chinensis var. chinensis]|uniref:Exocyst subunit Exo70 family protein n=1 Tax=Actinidia chinensis var. chinensis TaxID=1590841 RepID=A0A2R6PWC9_ACTCC|nr:Exocyst complex component EXO70A1 like [Actinidia chinensis var. chinensis]